MPVQSLVPFAAAYSGFGVEAFDGGVGVDAGVGQSALHDDRGRVGLLLARCSASWACCWPRRAAPCARHARPAVRRDLHLAGRLRRRDRLPRRQHRRQRQLRRAWHLHVRHRPRAAGSLEPPSLRRQRRSPARSTPRRRRPPVRRARPGLRRSTSSATTARRVDTADHRGPHPPCRPSPRSPATTPICRSAARRTAWCRWSTSSTTGDNHAGPAARRTWRGPDGPLVGRRRRDHLRRAVEPTAATLRRRPSSTARCSAASPCALDAVHGLRTLTADYPGDPAADEVASSASVAVVQRTRVAPVVTFSCPASVPARQPQTTCQVTVAGRRRWRAAHRRRSRSTRLLGRRSAGLRPTARSTAAPAPSPYEVFEGTVAPATAPVRATYSGDNNYLPGLRRPGRDVTTTHACSLDLRPRANRAAGTAALRAAGLDRRRPAGPGRRRCDAIVVDDDVGRRGLRRRPPTTAAAMSTPPTRRWPGSPCGWARPPAPSWSRRSTPATTFTMVAGSTAAFAFTAVPPLRAWSRRSVGVGQGGDQHPVSCAAAGGLPARARLRGHGHRGARGRARPARCGWRQPPATPRSRPRSCTLSAQGPVHVAVATSARAGHAWSR